MMTSPLMPAAFNLHCRYFPSHRLKNVAVHLHNCLLRHSLLSVWVMLQGRPVLIHTPKMWTPTYEWCMVGRGSKNGHHKRHVLKGEWSTCSKDVNHSRCNNQQNGEPLCDNFMSTQIFTLIMHKIGGTPKIMRKWLWASF